LRMAAAPLISWSKRFQPPHSADRYDAGCRGAGADRVAAVIPPKAIAQDAPRIVPTGLVDG
jgi:hypothetical protein